MMDMHISIHKTIKNYQIIGRILQKTISEQPLMYYGYIYFFFLKSGTAMDILLLFNLD